MAQETMTVHPRQERMRSPQTRGTTPWEALLAGISDTLRDTGTPVARLLCAGMMAVLTAAQLPGGGYACQAAMFAVLLRLGCCVPAAFLGVMAGFAVGYGTGALLCCWQLPVCVLLWLSAGLWARRQSRLAMAVAVTLSELSAFALTGVSSVYAVATTLLTAVAAGALSVLYCGAALAVQRRDELDGETRPLCVMAVCASLIAGVLPLPGGEAVGCALALYLTLEHAYVGGAQQALLCAGVMGGVLSVCLRDVQPLAMLVAGGFIAGEIKTQRRWLCALLMLLGMAAAAALLGGELERLRPILLSLPGTLPFLVLSPAKRSGVTALIERAEPEEMTQSEAVAVRCASMIHAWAQLYQDTAKMMEGLCLTEEETPLTRSCIDLLNKTSAAAHQVCERTLTEIRPDDDAYRRIRYELVRAGMEQIRVAYALRIAGRMEVMLLKPESIAPVTLQSVVARGCGMAMRPCVRDGLLCTQALFEQVPALDIEVGAATRSCSGEEVAGDSYVSRTLSGGRHVLALSDGMGSGVSARQESHAALTLMVESLRAGYTRAQAIDVVNALMLMCTGREMYATMDLFVCDLHTGETAFEKLGACASYVVRDGEVRSIGADTLPVGVLPEVEARSLRMTLQEGDVVVMLTDGVADAYPGGEEALRGAIGRLAWLHPQAVGEKLIAQALAGGEARDDMAVLCARICRAAIG